ncbi:MAG: DUF177 domain-containing protein [Actinomycetaceae bacterium]|nr:DUF177 domain-containing protein [Arcanobacterium sp.]MDD7686868.1 DUF177 domain-containing protein [Actinomycetaceae bacterium]MDY5274041.1 DUF177 domain-containing protein [Arcanobacterium sp.]
MMKRSEFVVSIADLPRQEGAQRHYTFTFAAPDGIGVDLLKVASGAAIEVDITFESVSEGVFVHGVVHTQAMGECARCLRPIDREVTEQIAELVYYPQSVAALADVDEEEADELPVTDGDFIDLEPLIRDAVVLALPLQPLCKPDCRGLCPECGERWEDLPADHHHEHFDPRMSALDELAAQLAAEAAE